MSDTEIVAGIEWHRDQHDPWCARCGSSADYIPCGWCGDECFTGHECGEDLCVCVDPEDNVVCDACGGRGGTWHCISTPAWCEAHPLLGREHIASTTMRAEAWRDA